MKKLITILLLSIGSLQAQNKFGNDYIFASDNFIEVDKQYHFIGGFIFAPIGYFYGLEKFDGDRSKAIWTGVALGTGVGLVKEITDINKTGFNTTDLVWTIVGATASTWITDKIHYPNYVRNRKEKEKVAQLEAERVSRLTDEEKLIEEISKR